MATTDAKPGFRLPWSAERSEPDAPAETAGDVPVSEALPHDQEIETPHMIDASHTATDQPTTDDEGSTVSQTVDEGSTVSQTVDEESTVSHRRGRAPADRRRRGARLDA